MPSKTKQYQFIKAVAILTGTIIGAGVLAVPYSVYYAGYWLGILYLIIFGIIMMILNLMLGEVVLRTKKNLPLPDLIKLYLGKKGYIIGFLSILVLIYGGMSAYIKGAGEIMNSILPINEFSWSAIFFLVGTYLVVKGLKVVSKWDIVFVTGMLLIIITIWTKSLYEGSIDWSQFQLTPIRSLQSAIQPYGVILFSYFGVIAIPHMKSILDKKASQMQAVIKFGVLIPILLYSVFVSLVIGVAGDKITPLAIIALGDQLGFQILVITSIFAILAMLTSFITMGLSMVDSYQNLSKINRNIAVILATFPPMAIVFFDWAQFNTIIQYAGGIGVSILSILIVLMFWRSKVKFQQVPAYSLGYMKWIGISMILIFVFGIFSLFI